MTTDAFVLEAMALDAVSVAREEHAVILTCRNHNGKDTIEAEDVHDLIADHDLWVSNTTADFDGGELRIEVRR